MSRRRIKRAVLAPGQVLRERRRRKGWSQAVLAGITGMAVSNLSNIECGRSRLGEDRAILLAAALGIGPELLLFPNGFERPDLQKRVRAIRRLARRLEGTAAA